MPSKPLDSLARIGKLKMEPGARAEVEGLLRSGKARLKDSASKALSHESRFDLAYNAAHALALAALRWHGYRSDNRYLVFQCLEHTLGMVPEQWRVLDTAHNKRNRAEYEGELDVDNALLEAMIRVTSDVCAKVEAMPSLDK